VTVWMTHVAEVDHAEVGADPEWKWGLVGDPTKNAQHPLAVPLRRIWGTSDERPAHSVHLGLRLEPAHIRFGSYLIGTGVRAVFTVRIEKVDRNI